MTSVNEKLGLLQKALGALAPASQMLDRFNHRHKNQHRSSRWWAQLDMLRRGVRKLLVEGQSYQAELERLDSGPKGKGKGKRAAAALGGDSGPFEIRARWLRDQAIPRAYLAFTQLAADNQYAALGLLLLGLLAQITAAISPLLGEGVGTGGPPLRELSPSRAPEGIENKSGASARADVGVAVARTDVEPASTVEGEERNGQQTHKQATGKVATAEDGIPSDTPGDGARPKLKRRKKRRKGDEFDDLFSSLI